MEYKFTGISNIKVGNQELGFKELKFSNDVELNGEIGTYKPKYEYEAILTYEDGSQEKVMISSNTDLSKI